MPPSWLSSPDTVHRVRHEKQVLRLRGFACRAPRAKLVRTELGHQMILAIAPDRPLGAVERHQRGKAHEVGEAGRLGTPVKARIGDAVARDRLRWRRDLGLDGSGKLDAPPP